MYESRGVCTAHATRIVCVCACGCTQTKTIYVESSLYQPAPRVRRPHPTDAGTHSGKCTWSLGLRIHDSRTKREVFSPRPTCLVMCSVGVRRGKVGAFRLTASLFPYCPSLKAHVGSTLGRHGARFPSSCWPRGSRRARWAGPLFLRCMIFPAFASRTPALRPPAGLAVVCLAAHTAAAQPLARAPCLHLSHSCVRTRKASTHSCERAQIGDRSMHRSRSGT